ncbi:MAG TPA: ClbS/DfsB family four-helix bundle protein [Phototrophicaceae bacterium]|nr:ClbS/DfsB family four-helix bundle protein [Phototrophicaceae bacterium]
MNQADNLTTREGVMRQLELGWNNLQTDLTALTEEQQTHLKDAVGWTVKDHLSHLAIWEQGVLALLEGKSKREAMEIPPEIWEQGDDAINAVIQVRYGDWSLAEVLRLLRKSRTGHPTSLCWQFRHEPSKKAALRQPLHSKFWRR